MNIMISGLTAAGKTTHCKVISERFGMRRIAVVDALMRQGGIDSTLDPADARLWLSPEAERLMELRRSSTALDLSVDRQLIEWSQNLDNVVFDAWALPWLTPAAAIRIWLESTPESRLTKSVISHQNGSTATREEIERLIQRKDREARDLFKCLYGFDIFFDRTVFDLVVDTSKFICEATQAASRESIHRVDAIVSSFVGWRLSGSDVCRTEFLRQSELHAREITWTEAAIDNECCGG